jgi:gluconate 2-dehydrogenase gamma chain
MVMEKSLSRRKFLVGALMALPLTELVLKGLTAAQAAEMAAPDLDQYQPLFFSGAEWQFILSAVDRLIPAGGSGKAPGGLETNVPIFIDQQLHSDFGQEMYMQAPFNPQAASSHGYQIPFYPQQIYQRGIALVQKCCQHQYRRPFSALSAAEQTSLLSALEHNNVNFADFGENDLQAKQLFSQLWADTKHGYLADPMYGGNKGMKAWIAIGFPGARASYLEWVKQHNIPYPLGPVSILGQQA